MTNDSPRIRKNSRLISIIITSLYFIGFIICTKNSYSEISDELLDSLFIIPFMTILAFGYGDTSAVLIWFIIILEMIALYFIVNWIVMIFLKEYCCSKHEKTEDKEQLKS